MPPSDWTALQLAEFLAAVSSEQSEAAAARAAVERAAEALDAEVAAIVCDGAVVASVGYPEAAVPAAELLRVGAGPAAFALAVPGVGRCPATGVALAHPPGATLVLARSGPALEREEGALLRGMARVASMTLQMLRSLEDERRAREESDRQAAENARLLATLTDRQASLERLAAEQAALRRVATLVAGQTAAQDVFAAVAEEVGRLLGADLAGVCRYEADEAMTVLPAWSSGALEVLPAGQRVPLDGASVAAKVLRTGRAARMDDYATVASGAIAERMRALGVRSSMGAPILVDGRVWGTMIVSTTRSEPFPDDGEQRLSAFTELVATAISNAASREQLAASRARVVATADQTRRRIERDLHDGIQQRLVTLGYELRALAERAQGLPQDVLARIARIERGVTDAHDELREIARGVHPAILSKGGLGPALRWLAGRSPLAVTLDADPLPRLPAAVEVAAYYIASEALTNAAKHARANTVELRLTLADDRLSVTIRDDGVGGLDSSKGSGIVGLVDRVEALNGTLEVISPPGGGTSLRADLPIGGEAGATSTGGPGRDESLMRAGS